MNIAGQARAAAVIAILLAVSIAGHGMAASIPPPAIRMQLEVGYGGNFRPDAWVPVRVRMTNAGPTVTGNLTVVDPGQSSAAAPYNKAEFTRGVVLPHGSTKDVALYIPGADLGQSISVSLMSTSRTLARQTVAASQVPSATLFVGVMSQNAAAIVQLKSLGGSLADIQLLTTPLDARTLDPTFLALANLDAIIVDNFDTGTLEPAQIAALEYWVRAGGTLILIGGPTAQATLAGLPGSLVPIGPIRLDVLKAAPGLSGLGSALPAGDIVAADGPPVDARVLLYTGGVATINAPAPRAGHAVVAERQLGLGSVIYSALDPTQQPLASWRGIQQLWTLLASPARIAAATATTRFAGIQSSSTTSTLNGEISSVTPPSITLYEALLAVYVLGLVPLNFLVLYRLRRRDWSWLTLPALAVLLVLGVFAGAYYGRGRDLRTNAVSVVYLTSGDKTATVQSFVGLVSPSAGDYAINSGDPGILGAPLFYSQQNGTPPDLSDVSSVVRVAEDTGTITMPAMRSWSSRSAVLDGTVRNIAALKSDLALTSSGKIVGNITNVGNSSLYGIVLQAAGGAAVPAGDLGPGATASVSLVPGATADNQATIPQTYGGLAYAPPERGDSGLAGNAAIGAPLFRIAMIGGTLLRADGPIPTNPNESRSQRFQNVSTLTIGGSGASTFNTVLAVGWKSTPALPLTVNGVSPARHDTDMVIQSLPIRVSPGRYALSTGAIPARLAGASQAFQTSFDSGGITISPNSAAIFVGALPLPQPNLGRLTVNSLTVSVNSAGAGGSLNSQTGALWNWVAGRWEAVDVSTGQATVRASGRFINGAGMVRVRVSTQSSTLNLNDPNGGVSLGAFGVVR